MLRSARKSAAIGNDGMNTDSSSPNGRNGGSPMGLPQHHTHVHHPVDPSRQHPHFTFHRNENPYSQHYATSMKGAIVSHLVTAMTSALMVVLLWNRFSIIPRNHSGTELIFRSQSNVGVFSKEIRRSTAIANHREEFSDPFYDLVVVGAGPAGLTASLFAARAGLNVLVVGSESGLLSEATSLDNFPSWKHPNYAEKGSSTNAGGQLWLEVTKQQAADTGVYFAVPGLTVSEITQKRDSLFSLTISGNTVNTMAVIVATGATGRKLNLPLEASFWGKSVHSCAICDGSAYKMKTVVVVGGGDAAVDAAILLSRHARSVIVVHRRNSLRASNQRNIQLMTRIPVVQVKTPFTVSQYLTNEASTTFVGVEIRDVDTNETEVVECDGIFVMIGSSPNTQFLNGYVELDKEGFILLNTDGTKSTSVEGIFAAGEVTDNQYKQAVTAASAGAQAAIDAERWLRPKMETGIMNESKRKLPQSIPLQANIVKGRSADKMERETVLENKSTNVADCTDIRGTDCIAALIHKYPVVVFSKSWCPYCKRALEALAIEGVTSEPFLLVVTLDRDTNGIQSTLSSMTGRRTVPNVFVGGTSIGGGDETVRLQQSGELKLMLKEASAIAET